MKKQLPLFKWTPTEWDVLEAMHECENLELLAVEMVNMRGHNMTLKSMMGEIHEIRKKMYEYSKHMAPSLDAVLEAQKGMICAIYENKMDNLHNIQNEHYAYIEKYRKLEDQCKKAAEITESANLSKTSLREANQRMWVELQEVRKNIYMRIAKGFFGSILISASLVFAYYMIFIRV